MAHIHEKIDFTSEVFIVCQNKVLLKRHKKYGSIWLSIGGHIELHEDPVEAAVREVKEEVGLDVVIDSSHQKYHIDEHSDDGFREVIPPVAIGRHHVDAVHEHIILVYFARSNSETVVPEEPTDEWRWVTKGELADMDLRPNIRTYAEAALDALSV